MLSNSTSAVVIAAVETTPGVVTLDLSWATDVAALLGILGIVGGAVVMWIRREVKKYFDEIKAEFKPNGGGSFKDQVNRLEKKHEELDAKFDTILDILSSVYASRLARMNSDKTSTGKIDQVNNRYIHKEEDK
jgi:hypothetical protein